MGCHKMPGSARVFSCFVILSLLGSRADADTSLQVESAVGIDNFVPASHDGEVNGVNLSVGVRGTPATIRDLPVLTGLALRYAHDFLSTGDVKAEFRCLSAELSIGTVVYSLPKLELRAFLGYERGLWGRVRTSSQTLNHIYEASTELRNFEAYPVTLQGIFPRVGSQLDLGIAAMLRNGRYTAASTDRVVEFTGGGLMFLAIFRLM